jgi:hypothetical protein
MYDKAGWSRTVSPDSWFAGLPIGAALERADDVLSRPDKYSKSMVPAAYRALVHHGVCTEEQASVGVAEVVKIRSKLLRNNQTRPHTSQL